MIGRLTIPLILLIFTVTIVAGLRSLGVAEPALWVVVALIVCGHLGFVADSIHLALAARRRRAV
jgi:hypothetical protein